MLSEYSRKMYLIDQTLFRESERFNFLLGIASFDLVFKNPQLQKEHVLQCSEYRKVVPVLSTWKLRKSYRR